MPEQYSPEPFLRAFEAFKGSFIDLDTGQRTSADQWRTLTGERLRELRATGVRPGDRIVIAMPNGALFACCWAAAILGGAAPIPVHFATPEPELASVATRWKARFVLTESGLSRAGEENAEPLLPLPSTPLHLTSGSTGIPKIAIRPGPCAVAEARHYIETLGIDASDKLLCVSPMSHAYAYGMCLMVPLLTSADVATMRRFHPRLAGRALTELGITIFPAVPAMLDILPFPDRAPALRAVLTAGAPLPARTATAYRERYNIRIRPLLGTTETGGISIDRMEDEFDGSVGPPMNGVEVAADEPRGDAGLLRVRSSSMMAGYLGTDGRVDRTPLEPEGWFYTGDLATVRSGKIFLHGRESEVINVLGLKVIPSEVEAVIGALPEVADVKVYAGRHRSGSERVHAAVVCGKPVSEDALREHCKQHLVAYKCPNHYFFLDALPRTPQGKIDTSGLPS